MPRDQVVLNQAKERAVTADERLHRTEREENAGSNFPFEEWLRISVERFGEDVPSKTPKVPQQHDAGCPRALMLRGFS